MKADRPSGTALVTALARAAERRMDPSRRIVDDPFAPAVVRAAGLGVLDDTSPLLHALADETTLGMATFVVARHRLLDDWMLAALEKGEIAQVVNLGSGYDARAWRLAGRLGDTPWFEVDHPATHRRKKEVFAEAVSGAAPSRGYRDVAVDFEKDDLLARLVETGCDRAKPTFFLWEGVTYYLEPATVMATFATIARGFAAGTRVGFDLWDPKGGVRLKDIYRRALVKVSPRLVAEPLKTVLKKTELAATLRRVGLKLEELHDGRDLGRAVGAKGRPVYPDFPVALASRALLPDEK
jgi:methyltransferase (TIGR00027 family)